jgi:hypothetical protein
MYWFDIQPRIGRGGTLRRKSPAVNLHTQTRFILFLNLTLTVPKIHAITAEASTYKSSLLGVSLPWRDVARSHWTGTLGLEASPATLSLSLSQSICDTA